MVEAQAGEDGQRGVIINTASIAAYEGQVCESRGPETFCDRLAEGQIPAKSPSVDYATDSNS